MGIERSADRHIVYMLWVCGTNRSVFLYSLGIDRSADRQSVNTEPSFFPPSLQGTPFSARLLTICGMKRSQRIKPPNLNTFKSIKYLHLLINYIYIDDSKPPTKHQPKKIRNHQIIRIYWSFLLYFYDFYRININQSTKKTQINAITLWFDVNINGWMHFHI